MNADDVHAKLHRALEEVTAAGPAGTAQLLLSNYVQPLALASIAFELHELREVAVEIQDVLGIMHDRQPRGPHGEL
jgi:hypothetical protein